MFQWYAYAEVCFISLSDLEPLSCSYPEEIEFWNDPARVSQSRWFTRGWTLQELLAPAKVEFYDRTWYFRFTRGSQAADIMSKIKINEHLLKETGKTDVEELHHTFRKVSVDSEDVVGGWGDRRQESKTKPTAYSGFSTSICPCYMEKAAKRSCGFSTRL